MNERFNQLPEMIRTGDSVELSKLLSDLRSYIISILVKDFHADKETAEDIVQSVLYMLTVKSRDGTIRPEMILAYCAKSAINTMITMYNKNRLRPTSYIETMEGFETVQRCDVTDDLDEQQTRKELNRYSNHLYPGQKRIFRIMMDVPGIHTDELSELLEISRISGRTSVHKIRKKLMKMNPDFNRFVYNYRYTEQE